MKPFQWFALLLCLCLSVGKCDDPNDRKKKEDEEQQKDQKVFKATSNWQPLPKDEAIPRGLHVRLNLKTGEREAKLLDDENQDEEDAETRRLVRVGSSPDDQDPEKSSGRVFGNIGRDELKNLLRKLELEQAGDEPSQEVRDERVKKRFRSYEELQRELAGEQTKVKTELEALDDLLAKWSTTTKDPETGERHDDPEATLPLLEDLQLLVHQGDNARHFVKTGLSEVVFPCLNSSHARVRYEATKLLGAAVQSNPRAQSAALEQGALTSLLRAIAIDASNQVKSGALHSVSCLVRRFPEAQARLVERGGLNVLAKLFTSDTSDHLKLQVKTVTLLGDLLLEADEAEMEGTGAAWQVERRRQYRRTGLRPALSEEGFCSLTISLLNKAVENEDEETIEKVVWGLGALARDCTSQEMRQVLPSLRTLLADYSEQEEAHTSLPLISQLLENATRLALEEDEVHLRRDEL